MRHKLRRLSQRLGERLPDLEGQLRDAGIRAHPVEYLSASILLAGLGALAAFTLSAIAFTLGGKSNPPLSVALTAFAFAFILFLRLRRPAQMMSSRAGRIERSLVFSLYALNIELESGIGFAQAVADVAGKDYGEFSQEMRSVMDETQKYGLRAALEASARRNPSAIYRRVVWQTVNALQTGADMRANIKSIVEDLRRRQEDEAKRYGKSTEKYMTLYVMGAIVFPALSIVLLQALTSFGLSDSPGERTYWAVLLFSASVQVLFIYAIKFKKPTLLGESLIRSRTHDPVRHLRELLEYAGVETPFKTYLLSASLLSIASGIALTLALEPHMPLSSGTLLAATTALSAATIYARLAWQADTRGIRAAEYLPDSLRLMSANMKAGISTDQALFMSAKPEFGILGAEIRRMGCDMLKNVTLEEALQKLKRRIKSEQLHMSVNLIGHGIAAGRGLGDSLSHIAAILEDREHARRAVATHLQAVRTLVVLLVMVSAPLLYGASMVAASIMGRLNEKLASSMPQDILMKGWLRPGASPVTEEFLNGYITVNLMVTAFLGSIIVGEVTTGKSREGLRYSLMMLLVCELLYVLFKSFLADKLGGAFT
jgi:archaeal flagellar protein FlaJ